MPEIHTIKNRHLIRPNGHTSFVCWQQQNIGSSSSESALNEIFNGISNQGERRTIRPKGHTLLGPWQARLAEYDTGFGTPGCYSGSVACVQAPCDDMDANYIVV